MHMKLYSLSVTLSQISCISYIMLETADLQSSNKMKQQTGKCRIRHMPGRKREPSCFSQCVPTSCLTRCMWKQSESLLPVPLSCEFLSGSLLEMGWTYGLDGTLLKATRISGIKNFNKNDFGLVPIRVATWGPFVLARFDDESTEGDLVGDEWLGSASELLSTNGIDTSLPHICRREYIINCNWKVFCDNYLDGGYHVPYAHGDLASGLQLQSYETLTYERVSVQRCEIAPSESDDFERLGTKALYAFVYPNFMINRYGPWMDTNLAVPLGSTKCKVVFDYFLDKSLLDDQNFIERSLKDSEQVQVEDIALCEGVQRGLESPAYSVGRYAPSVEMAMHHFHCLLHANLSG